MGGVQEVVFVSSSRAVALREWTSRYFLAFKHAPFFNGIKKTLTVSY